MSSFGVVQSVKSLKMAWVLGAGFGSCNEGWKGNCAGGSFWRRSVISLLIDVLMHVTGVSQGVAESLDPVPVVRIMVNSCGFQ